MDQDNINIIDEQEIVETVEEQQVENEQVQTEVQEEVQEEPEVAEVQEDKPSRRESLRIQKLIEKLKQNEKPEDPLPKFKGLDYESTLDADSEVIEQLNNDRKNYAEQAYNEGLERAKSIQFHTRLEIDAPKVISKYQKLDPDNKEQFNPVLADAINTWYLNTAGYNSEKDTVTNSNIRYSEFVDSIFELANEIAGDKVQSSVKNIAKQAATTGLRPDGSTVKKMNLNQPIDKMSMEELIAYGKQLGL